MVCILTEIHGVTHESARIDNEYNDRTVTGVSSLVSDSVLLCQFPSLHSSWTGPGSSDFVLQ